jgi:carbon-monoxide dehydrogenase large subunit
LYTTPAVFVEVTGVFSNTVPTDAYRGAGRPEACYVLERLADKAALELGLDRAEIRRRNLIPRKAMPYKTPVGPTYDCGDFPRVFERALEISEYRTFEARKEESRLKKRLRGIGLACYIESSGVAPSRLAGMMGARGGFYEVAQVRVAPDGSITAYLGTHNHGQGHATSFAQILGARLGVAMERISIVEGDTAAVAAGTGTFGSRSIAVGGSALHFACEKIISKGKKIAAHLLEAAASASHRWRTRRTCRTAIRSRRSSRGWMRPPSTIPAILRSRTACTSAKSRSIRTPDKRRSPGIARSTTSAR